MPRSLPIFTAAVVCAFAGRAAKAETPTELLAESRRRLMSYPALTADLLIRADLPSGRVETTGRYVAGAFPRLRTETAATLAGVSMKSLSVCDGQVLWTVRELRTGPDAEPEVRVARRDVERIRQELALEPRTASQVLSAEMAVGGLPALLAGLEGAYEFAESQTAAGSRLFVGRRTIDEGPDGVRVTFDAATLIPTRVLYLDEKDGKAVPVLNLELRNIAAPASVDESRFRFTPPRGAEIANRTDDTLRAIRGE